MEVEYTMEVEGSMEVDSMEVEDMEVEYDEVRSEGRSDVRDQDPAVQLCKIVTRKIPLFLQMVLVFVVERMQDREMRIY